jgi:tetratricopeptide (TPR) repeat protein
MSSLQNEVTLLEQYNSELERLGNQLAQADPQSSKKLQQQIDQRLQIYWKQIHLVQSQFPDSEDGKIHEAAFYTFQAQTKVFSSGAMRRVSSRSGNMAVGLATGLIAKQQEKNNAVQALSLLDKALGVFDYPGAHLAKAEIYRALGQAGSALNELNYIIANFQDDNSYVAARQIKDEIENPPKKGMCFVATAAFGSALAPEVVVLSSYRDNVLLKSLMGRAFVRFYYSTSPPFAWVIAKSSFLRALTRRLFIAPLLCLIRGERKTHSPKL